MCNVHCEDLTVSQIFPSLKTITDIISPDGKMENLLGNHDQDADDDDDDDADDDAAVAVADADGGDGDGGDAGGVEAST